MKIGVAVQRLRLSVEKSRRYFFRTSVNHCTLLAWQGKVGRDPNARAAVHSLAQREAGANLPCRFDVVDRKGLRKLQRTPGTGGNSWRSSSLELTYRPTFDETTGLRCFAANAKTLHGSPHLP